MSSKVFICYRKDDSAWPAKHIASVLAGALQGRVFYDVDNVEPGEELKPFILGQLRSSSLVLAVIGPNWLKALEDRKHLPVESDWVREELQTAFTLGIRVVPVLLDGAPMPALNSLPEGLRRLHDVSAFRMSADQRKDELDKLIQMVCGKLGAPQTVSERPGAPSATPRTTQGVMPWASNTGTDPHGRWAEFSVDGVAQRLRWIGPGSFWMGSPASEKERFDDEMRHRVTLTRGFWLADTACTQALWQAVLGSNPSRFRGNAQLPVEQVSWNEVTKQFLPKLKQRLPDLDARLPTEAEWEYACRTGTETPFHFGVQITPAHVNYDGHHPYAGGAEGEYREKTVPVKSLPANAWGLYEVHGNVWEWCADGYGPYPTGEVSDPQGVPNAASRVFRGGAWGSLARGCRAAGRGHGSPGDRDRLIGFRLCVSSPI